MTKIELPKVGDIYETVFPKKRFTVEETFQKQDKWFVKIRTGNQKTSIPLSQFEDVLVKVEKEE